MDTATKYNILSIIVHHLLYMLTANIATPPIGMENTIYFYIKMISCILSIKRVFTQTGSIPPSGGLCMTHSL